MNGKDIFRGLQYIGDDLIENAETGQFPAQNQESGKTHRPIRRPLLIAALIALLLLLVGCAVDNGAPHQQKQQRDQRRN